MKKMWKYVTLGYTFIKKAEEADVLPAILDAIEDKKITYKEMFIIGEKLCKVFNIDLNTKGIKL